MHYAHLCAFHLSLYCKSLYSCLEMHECPIITEPVRLLSFHVLACMLHVVLHPWARFWLLQWGCPYGPILYPVADESSGQSSVSRLHLSSAGTQIDRYKRAYVQQVTAQPEQQASRAQVCCTGD